MIKPKGTIVIACECREGFGSREYSSLCERGQSAHQFFDQYSRLENFVIDQWCLQTTYQALDFAEKIYVYSPNLSRKHLRAMGFEPIEDLQASVDALLPQARSVLVAPEGPYVVGLGGARLGRRLTARGWTFLASWWRSALGSAPVACSRSRRSPWAWPAAGVPTGEPKAPRKWRLSDRAL